MELNVSNALKTVLTQLSELYAVYWLLQKSGDFLVVSWIRVACVLLGSYAVPHVFFKATYFHCDSIVHVRIETIVGTVLSHVGENGFSVHHYGHCLVFVMRRWCKESVNFVCTHVGIMSFIYGWTAGGVNSRSLHLNYCWTCSVWENRDTVSNIGNWLHFHMVITKENFIVC